MSYVADKVDMRDVICELDVDFVFPNDERERLYKKIAEIRINPYRHYNAFKENIAELLHNRALMPKFLAFMEGQKTRDLSKKPFLFIKNAPIDKILPIFDFVDPVTSKHALKKTFIAEGFLSLIGTLTDTHPIGYLNVNDGDVFQDIYPKESMKDTQSQKALGEIYFHKDLANHFVRPDHVNMLAMRSSVANQTLTTFVRNVDIFQELSPATQEALRKRDYYTPFDDLTVNTSNIVLGDAEKHAVLEGDNDVRFFENRTIGFGEEAQNAVTELVRILHKVKRRVFMLPGDFICVQNNYALHGKELGTIAEEETLRTRWMIKTVNVDSVERIRTHFVPGSDYLING